MSSMVAMYFMVATIPSSGQALPGDVFAVLAHLYGHPAIARNPMLQEEEELSESGHWVA